VLAGTHFGGAGFGPVLSADATPAVARIIAAAKKRLTSLRIGHPPPCPDSSPLNDSLSVAGPRADARTSDDPRYTSHRLSASDLMLLGCQPTFTSALHLALNQAAIDAMGWGSTGRSGLAEHEALKAEV
jgi:hypothetical protein